MRAWISRPRTLIMLSSGTGGLYELAPPYVVRSDSRNFREYLASNIRAFVSLFLKNTHDPLTKDPKYAYIDFLLRAMS